jgi:galactose mutarotase-like enzyme
MIGPPSRHDIAADGIAATISADGAELCSLRNAAGREFLWQALPAWPRHAPVLFPIVGRLAGDTLRHQGRSYTLTQHGFARDRRFAWAARSAAACRLVLTDDAQTRAQYPFAFHFALSFAVTGDTLRVTCTLRNPNGAAALPAAMGAHPAFRWPLQEGLAKEAHVLEFAQDEPAPIRRLAGGLLLPAPQPTPIAGRTLPLTESLFAADAIILDRPASQAVRFTAPGGPAVEVAWRGFRQLGIWMRPGADFLCIEPWHGFADPVGFTGAFADKPGLLHIPPGGQVEAEFSVRLVGPAQ